MIGGAGGAYNYLFSNFDVYYKLLYDVINKYPIDSIDLDIEEPVKLNDVKMLIRRIRKDFKENFIISMAPISYSLKTNSSV
jgi:chitinase